jgi:hypothetical protein
MSKTDSLIFFEQIALSSKEDLLSSLSWTANQSWAGWCDDVQRIENLLVKTETEFSA